MTQGTEQKPATAARIYDYHLGGTHNFPADRAAGQAVADRNPLVPAMARTNRAFLRRAYLTGSAFASSSISAPASRQKATCTRSHKAWRPTPT
jgi:hypothetical protein